jgi:NAD(P)-dependent dehydrogenase (short-subunit alcohol dehydrogenase family)
MKLTGKVALVSGADGGIGRAICLAFAEAVTACCDIDAASAEETARVARNAAGRATAQPAMLMLLRRGPARTS